MMMGKNMDPRYFGNQVMKRIGGGVEAGIGNHAEAEVGIANREGVEAGITVEVEAVITRKEAGVVIAFEEVEKNVGVAHLVTESHGHTEELGLGVLLHPDLSSVLKDPALLFCWGMTHHFHQKRGMPAQFSVCN